MKAINIINENELVHFGSMRSVERCTDFLSLASPPPLAAPATIAPLSTTDTFDSALADVDVAIANTPLPDEGDDDDDLIATAYHEASHCVVGMYVGYPLEHVTLHGPRDGVAVLCHPKPLPLDHRRALKTRWDHLLVSVAGYLSTELYVEYSTLGEFDTSAPELKKMFADGIAARFGLLPSKGLRLISGRIREGWNSEGNSDDCFAVNDAIDIASILKNKKSTRWGWDDPKNQPVLDIVEAAERKATKILMRRWNDVERIAESLLRRRNRKMSGRQVKALLRDR